MTISLQKITPCLWFDHQAEEAANFYTSIFNNSKVLNITRLSEGGRGPVGNVMTVAFELEGQSFTALNGGPHFTFSPAISFAVSCETQEEVDVLWERLSENGVIEQCGWLRDQFGVSWQIIPTVLMEMLNDSDSTKSLRVMQAVLQMKKLDIGQLKEAFNNK
ncbi:VOC family protein [Peribacillus alkalitolerans]|uniref:VOC family protein n=1 Tax=Peribacillus alkalitolerans TaxID=1550385 RepID=UPI00196837DA|nr:VOC family protein [Peribacillus alkalitolerans]